MPPPRAIGPAELIAHPSPIVVAGLASALGREPDFDVSVLDCRDTARYGLPHLPGRHVVFGDFDLWSLARGVAPGRRACAAWARFVVVTSVAPCARPDAGVDGEPDEWLSVECRADQLSATVGKLRRTAIAPPAANTSTDDDPSGPGSSASRAGIARPSHRGGMAPGRLRAVRDHVERHLAEKIELDALSDIAGLSVCHFARAFKQSTGIPPHRYVTTRRIAAAADRIRETDQPFAQIALDVGFSDQSHFTKTFVQVTGETPRVFRRRFR